MPKQGAALYLLLWNPTLTIVNNILFFFNYQLLLFLYVLYFNPKPLFLSFKETKYLAGNFHQSSRKMSCNGCRILRKGCSDECMLRQCLQWLDNPEAQANATLFVAKFFGRAGLMSFLSSVPINQRPSLFQSLLFEAVGRAVNPVSGAVGLLWTGNWHVCQKAAMTVLSCGTIQPELEYQDRILGPNRDNNFECCSFRPSLKRKRSDYDYDCNLDLCLMFPPEDKQRLRDTTSSEAWKTTTFGCNSGTNRSSQTEGERKLLTLFM